MKDSAILGVLVIAMCGGCAGPAPSWQFIQQAQRLHDAALAPTVTSDPDLRDYVQLVGKRIEDAAHLVDANRTHDALFSSMNYHLVACAAPNVVTTGGAHIYIFNGLFQACQSEDELAAAISHAFAHAMSLDLEHVDLRPDPQTPLPMVAWELATHAYSNTQERAADRLGFEIYLKAGYDPRRYSGLLEHLAERYPGVQSPDRTPLLIRAQESRTWGAPVPSSPDRPLPVADPKTFESLRRQARSLNPSQTPAISQVILLALPNCMLSGQTPEQQAALDQLKPPTPARRLEPS